jgi:protein-S-isoprenylcysteine O-methyltransferase Ste14
MYKFQPMSRLREPRFNVASVISQSELLKEPAIMITVLLVILLLMAVGAFPSWNYSRSWGYFPSGGLGLVVLVLLILLLLGRV